jgi:anti-sigma28 factor (negative regulator of flagellin synthesis)
LKEGGMKMDINRIGQNYTVQNLYNKKTKSVESSEKEEKQIKKPALSGDSKKYLELSKSIPETRTKLIEDMKFAIENNLYKIDSENIVKKMLGGF